MGTKEYTLKTHTETYENSTETYVAYDQDGEPVSFKKKSKEHQSQHKIYQHPTFFENLPIIIQQPHVVVINPKSKNPKSIQSAKKGTIKKYVRKRYVRDLNLPFYTGFEDDSVVVIVLYNNNPTENPKNLTLTYYVQKEL
ncbi:hypothetical protein CANDROIZ_230001 [Candidatus Roizmanbacteria bacterium]|nr:hypothetical protein CANDROIZ_230001 [Candidatus Roizmanbacteria bacterium]